MRPTASVFPGSLVCYWDTENARTRETTERQRGKERDREGSTRGGSGGTQEGPGCWQEGQVEAEQVYQERARGSTGTKASLKLRSNAQSFI